VSSASNLLRQLAVAPRQWRGPGGAIAHEAPKVVMIVYANDDSATYQSAKIETIDSLYKARFNQESVLRMRSIVQASF